MTSHGYLHAVIVIIHMDNVGVVLTIIIFQITAVIVLIFWLINLEDISTNNSTSDTYLYI